MHGLPLSEGALGDGKSGSHFFYSCDRKYVVKTVKKSEMPTLLGMLDKYVESQKANPVSLLPRFFGLYSIAFPNQPPLRIVVMANVFFSTRNLRLHSVFDLKGSFYKVSRTPGVGHPG